MTNTQHMINTFGRHAVMVLDNDSHGFICMSWEGGSRYTRWRCTVLDGVVRAVKM